MGSEVMTIELSDPTGTLLQEIAAKRYTRNTVAKTYALAIRGEVPVDWRRVNVAIIARWSPYALEWIKSRAWSGKCFEDKKGRAGVMGKPLDQSVFEGQPTDVTLACVDYDGLLKFGKNVGNYRYTWASERWRGADWVSQVEGTDYEPLTSLQRCGCLNGKDVQNVPLPLRRRCGECKHWDVDNPRIPPQCSTCDDSHHNWEAQSEPLARKDGQ